MKEFASSERVETQVSIQHNRYPFCLVWTALPCLTCCLPCIGHTGICKSDGTIFDFVGMGAIHSGQLAFGAPLKYMVLEHSNMSDQEWDEAIDRANKQFEKTHHNLLVNNCHHHVATALNNMNYKGKTNWGQVDIALLAAKSVHTSLLSYYIYALLIALIVYSII